MPETEETKPLLRGLFRDHPDTPEGKYLVKRRDGTVVEWPSFVLGARDPHAAVALRAYAASADKDPSFTDDFIQALYRYAEEWDSYRETHGDGDPAAHKHRKDDQAILAEMRRGHSA